jgi:membrane-associated phospholipid phosphatase
MLDNMALQDGEENKINSATENAKTFRTQFAHYVSIILSPLVISLPAIVMVGLYHNHALSSLLFAAIAVFFLSVGPMIYIAIGVGLGKFTDIDVSVRSQRVGPFIFGISSGLIGFFILQVMHAPYNLETVLLATVIAGLIFMVITFWWKISMHASSISGTITFLAVLYGNIVLPAFLLVALVGWSRVILKRHTAMQVTIGAILSAVITLTILFVRGVR